MIGGMAWFKLSAYHLGKKEQKPQAPQRAEGEREGYRVAETFPDVATHLKARKYGRCCRGVGLLA